MKLITTSDPVSYEKIIFLDIDGVLNNDTGEADCEKCENNKCRVDPKFHDFSDVPCEKCIKNLNKILKETGAEVVLSSTWRIIHNRLSIMYILFLSGMCPAYIEDYTPIMHGETRGTEIAAWLKEHPETKRFIIIDDDSDMENLMDHLVHIDSEVGLTEGKADEAIKMLNK